MATIKYTLATDLDKYLRLIPVGETAEIPNKMVKESSIRQKCTRMKKYGFLFKVSAIGLATSTKVTRLK